MSNDPKAGSVVVSIGRVISAAYLAMVLTGPPPMGYCALAFESPGRLVGVMAVLLLIVLRSLFAGILAGRSLAIWAVLVTSTWAFDGPLLGMVKSVFRSPLDGYWLIGLLGSLIFITFSALSAVALGIAGGRLAERLSPRATGRHACVWIAIGILAIAQLSYTYVVGAKSALRVLEPTVKSSTVKGCRPGVEVEIRGILPAVWIWPYGMGRGPSDVYYLDPTGRYVIGKSFVEAD